MGVEMRVGVLTKSTTLSQYLLAPKSVIPQEKSDSESVDGSNASSATSAGVLNI